MKYHWLIGEFQQKQGKSVFIGIHRYCTKEQLQLPSGCSIIIQALDWDDYSMQYQQTQKTHH